MNRFVKCVVMAGRAVAEAARVAVVLAAGLAALPKDMTAPLKVDPAGLLRKLELEAVSNSTHLPV